MEGGRSDICADSIAEFYQASEPVQNPMQSTAPPKMLTKVPTNENQITTPLNQPPIIIGDTDPDRMSAIDKLIHKDMV